MNNSKGSKQKRPLKIQPYEWQLTVAVFIRVLPVVIVLLMLGIYYGIKLNLVQKVIRIFG